MLVTVAVTPLLPANTQASFVPVFVTCITGQVEADAVNATFDEVELTESDVDPHQTEIDGGMGGPWAALIGTGTPQRSIRRQQTHIRDRRLNNFMICINTPILGLHGVKPCGRYADTRMDDQATQR